MAKTNSSLLPPPTLASGSQDFDGFRDDPLARPPSCSGATVVEQFKRFKESGAPSRVLIFRDGSWTDFAREVVDVLRDGFVAGKATLEVAVGGASQLFDFLRMVQVDLGSGASNSIAWIDVAGRCFFPQPAVHGHKHLSGSKQRISSFSSSSSSSSSSVVSSEEYLTAFLQERSDENRKWPGTEVLKQEDRYHKVVSKLFLAGTRRFDPTITITSIHRCLYSAQSRNSRLKAFEMQIGATEAAHGRENTKFGWMATSPSDLAAIIAHGFSQANDNKMPKSDANAVVLHLSPPHSPYPSCLLSEMDDKGERHILLCRAIMGRADEVEAGSLEKVDATVDDLANPKCYTVCSTRMLPEFVVSYKFSQPSQGAWRISSKRLTAANSSFSKMFIEIKRTLPSSMARELEITYAQYRGGKMSKEAFIRYLRSTVGDKLLTLTISRIRGY